MVLSSTLMSKILEMILRKCLVSDALVWSIISRFDRDLMFKDLYCVLNIGLWSQA